MQNLHTGRGITRGAMTTFPLWRSRGGTGPRLLAYAEYDAVPGNCQARSLDRTWAWHGAE